MVKGLKETTYTFPGQSNFYRGKVRDVYSIGGKLVIISSDRISAFDHILPQAIPYKGQVLNQLSYFFLQKVSHILPVWANLSPASNVSMGVICAPLDIEVVVRGYLAGHAWREYKEGKRKLCGVALPDGLKEGDRLPAPIITPATKAKSGHDEDISHKEIIKRNIVSTSMYAQIEKYALQLFQFGTDYALSKGLILVDTKYEFGLYQDEVYLIDEIHTPDSSRYYVREGYEQRQRTELPQVQLSKEFVREWLMDNGFMGREEDIMPKMSDSFVDLVSSRYIDLYQRLTGLPFEKASYVDIEQKLYNQILKYL